MTKKDRYIKKSGPTAKVTKIPKKQPAKLKVPWSNQYGNSKTWGKQGVK